MSGTRYHIYEIQLQEADTGETMLGAGGVMTVVTAGGAAKATLYNPDTFASLANPITPTRGKFRFATLATVESVDVYGMSAGGHSFHYLGAKPAAPVEVFIDTHQIEQVAVIPWAAADTTASTETDTGWNLPIYGQVMPGTSIIVTAIDATETIDVGLLSSESGGDADGFLVGASVATLGRVPGLLVGTDTLGALLKEDTNASSVLVPKAYPVGLTAVSVTYTLSAGSDTGAGFICIPYHRSPLN